MIRRDIITQTHGQIGSTGISATPDLPLVQRTEIAANQARESNLVLMLEMMHGDKRLNFSDLEKRFGFYFLLESQLLAKQLILSARTPSGQYLGNVNLYVSYRELYRYLHPPRGTDTMPKPSV